MNNSKIDKVIPKRNRVNINVITLILFVNFIIENFLYYFDDRSVLISLQAFINLVSIIFLLVRTRNLKKPPLWGFVVILSLYPLVFSIMSSNLIQSINISLKFILPLFYLHIGYNILKSVKELVFFVKKLYIFLYFFIGNILYVNIFNVGESFYDKGIKVGYMSNNSMYTSLFTTIILLYFYNMNLSKKKIAPILFLSSSIIFLLILKRTLILLLILAVLFYLMRKLNIRKILAFGLSLIVFIFIINNAFQEELNEAFDSRSSRFSEDYQVTEEGRFVENSMPFEHMKDNTIQYIFGTGEVFNDRPYYYRYKNVDRELHNSFARLFWNGGIVLLVTFITFYISIFLKIKAKYSIPSNMSVYKNIFYFAMVLVVLRFISEFSSGLTYISYNSICYLIIGGVFALSQTQKSTNNKVSSSI